MAKRIPLNVKVPNIVKNQKTDPLIEKRKRQARLDKIIRNIYAYNRKSLKAPVNTDSDKENCGLEANPATANKRNKRPRLSKQPRKRSRPTKLTSKRNVRHFMFYCIKKNRKRRKQVRRGYLNEARKKVEYEVRMKNFNIKQNIERFHENANTLLREILHLRRRVDNALNNTLECKNEKSEN